MMLRIDKKLTYDKIIYGTAKIGNPNYGVSSIEKEYTFAERIELLYQLIESGVRRFDSSPRYFPAEEILGQALSNFPYKDFLVDTKVDGITLNKKRDEKKISTQIYNSLNLLKGQKINTLYLHQNEIEIISNKDIQKLLIKFKEEGLISRIGTSVYNLIELKYTLYSGIYDVVQIPLNILNHSFYKAFLENEWPGIEVNARSIFLQGRLLNYTSNKNLNTDLELKLEQLYKLCDKYNSNIENEAKRNIYQFENINFIISSLSINNFKKNLCYYDYFNSKKFDSELISIQDKGYNFTNPRNWM